MKKIYQRRLTISCLRLMCVTVWTSSYALGNCHCPCQARISFSHCIFCTFNVKTCFESSFNVKWFCRHPFLRSIFILSSPSLHSFVAICSILLSYFDCMFGVFQIVVVTAWLGSTVSSLTTVMNDFNFAPIITVHFFTEIWLFLS